MDDEIDIYGDLDNLEGEKIEITSKAAKELQEENGGLQMKIEELNNKLEEIRKYSKSLETNISSLVKTAKVEIARKDRMIADLRQQLDDAAFRRTSNFRIPKRPPIRPAILPLPPKDESTCTEIRKEIVNETIKKEEVEYQSPLLKDEEHSDDEDLPTYPDKPPVTVFGERLRKRLQQEASLELQQSSDLPKPIIKAENCGPEIKEEKDHQYRLIPLTLQKQAESTRKRGSENVETPDNCEEVHDAKKRRIDPEDQKREKPAEKYKSAGKCEDRRRPDREEPRRERSPNDRYKTSSKYEDRRRCDRENSPERYRNFSRNEDRRRLDREDPKRARCDKRRSIGEDHRRNDRHLKREKSPDVYKTKSEKAKSGFKSEDRRSDREDHRRDMSSENHRTSRRAEEKISSISEDRRKIDREDLKREAHKMSPENEDLRMDHACDNQKSPQKYHTEDREDPNRDRSPETRRISSKCEDRRLDHEDRDKSPTDKYQNSAKSEDRRRLEIDAEYCCPSRSTPNNEDPPKRHYEDRRSRRSETTKSRSRSKSNDRRNVRDRRDYLDRRKNQHGNDRRNLNSRNQNYRTPRSLEERKTSPAYQRTDSRRSNRDYDRGNKISREDRMGENRRTIWSPTNGNRPPREKTDDRETHYGKINRSKSRSIDRNVNSIAKNVKGERDKNCEKNAKMHEKSPSIERELYVVHENLDEGSREKNSEANVKIDADIEEGEIPDSPSFSEPERFSEENLQQEAISENDEIRDRDLDQYLKAQNLDDSAREEKIENIERFIAKMQTNEKEDTGVHVEDIEESREAIDEQMRERDTSDESVHLTSILQDSSDEEIDDDDKLDENAEMKKTETIDMVTERVMEKLPKLESINTVIGKLPNESQLKNEVIEKIPEKLHEKILPKNVTQTITKNPIVCSDKDNDDKIEDVPKSCTKLRPILQEIGSSTTSVKLNEMHPQKTVPTEKENGGKGGQKDGKIVVARRRKVRLTDASTSITIVKSEDSVKN